MIKNATVHNTTNQSWVTAIYRENNRQHPCTPLSAARAVLQRAIDTNAVRSAGTYIVAFVYDDGSSSIYSLTVEEVTTPKLRIV